MTGPKTNERPGVRAHLRGARFSAYKAREVLDLVRGLPIGEARAILEFTERSCSEPILKLLNSAVANAGNNNDIPPDELFISACYADEGPTMRRFRPRARGRGTRIRKRTCQVTIIVGRMSADDLDRMRTKASSRGRVPADAVSSRTRRVQRSRQKSGERIAAAEAAEAAEAEALENSDTEGIDETVDDALVVGESSDSTDTDSTDAEATDTTDETDAHAANTTTEEDAVIDDATDENAKDA